MLNASLNKTFPSFLPDWLLCVLRVRVDDDSEPAAGTATVRQHAVGGHRALECGDISSGERAVA